MELVNKQYYADNERCGFYLDSDSNEHFSIEMEINPIWMTIDELITQYEWVVSELKEFRDGLSVDSEMES